MMARCVVFVDAVYLRRAAQGLMVDGGYAVGPVPEALPNVSVLMTYLQTLAEDLTGEDCLRIYWYEGKQPPDADREQVRGHAGVCVRPLVRRGSPAREGGAIASDLAQLLAQPGCGDVVVCSADAALATVFLSAQDQCRQVHWLRVGAVEVGSSTALWPVSDTRHDIASAVISCCFTGVGYDADDAIVENDPLYALKSDEVHRSGSERGPVDGYAPPDRPASVLDHGSDDGWRSSDQALDYTVDQPYAVRSAPSAHASEDLPRVPVVDLWGDDPFAAPSRSHYDEPAVRLAPVSSPPPRGRVDSYLEGERVRPRRTPDPTSRTSLLDLPAELRAVAEEVAVEVGAQSEQTLRSWQRGIPSPLDRELLSRSFAALGTKLDQEEKHALRRAFVDACIRLAAGVRP